jgi:hypothetical protein
MLLLVMFFIYHIILTVTVFYFSIEIWGGELAVGFDPVIHFLQGISRKKMGHTLL